MQAPGLRPAHDGEGEEPQLHETLSMLLKMQAAGTPNLDAAISALRARLHVQQDLHPPLSPSVDAKPAPHPQPQPVPVVSTTRACAHNSWDNVRTKKGQVFLRCRQCDAQWRTPVDSLDRCVAFNTVAGCPRGEECPQLHLHTRKQSLSERVALHGPTVLERVPVGAADEGLPPEAPRPPPTAPPPTEGKVSVPQHDVREDQSTSTVSTTRPCNHNSWDNVRTKKGQVFLRCRDCEAQWRTPVDGLDRCIAFNTAAGCPHGYDCKHLHLHTRKQSLSERLAKHGSAVLDRVPTDAASGKPVSPCSSTPSPPRTQHTASSTSHFFPQASEPQHSHQPPTQHPYHHHHLHHHQQQQQQQQQHPQQQQQHQHQQMHHLHHLHHHHHQHHHHHHHHNHHHSHHHILTPELSQQKHQQPPLSVPSQPPMPPVPPPQHGYHDVLFTIHKAHGPSVGATVKGNQVTKVEPNSPAAIAGIREGMTVLAVNGAPVSKSTNEVVAAVRAAWQDRSSMQVLARASKVDTGHLDCDLSDILSISSHNTLPDTPVAPTMPTPATYSETGGTAPSVALFASDPTWRPQSSCAPVLPHDVETASQGSRVSYPPLDVVINLSKAHPQQGVGMTVKGNMVTKVIAGSPAALAGVVEGVQILAVNGVQVGPRTNDVVNAVRHAWQNSTEMQLAVRHIGDGTQGSTATAPPLLDGSASDFGSDAGSLPETPRMGGVGSVGTTLTSLTTTIHRNPSVSSSNKGFSPQVKQHTPYAKDDEMNDKESTKMCDCDACSTGTGMDSNCPPLLQHLSRTSDGRASRTGSEAEVVYVSVVRQSEKDSFGATIKGSLVTRVAQESAADAAGLQEGMRILSVNGTNVNMASSEEIVKIIRTAWATHGVINLSLINQVAMSYSDWDGCSTANLSVVSASSGGTHSSWNPYDPCPDSPPADELHETGITVYMNGVVVSWPHVEVAEGTRGWVDRQYLLSSFPESCKGGLLFQGPHKNIVEHTTFAIKATEDADVFLIHSNAPGRDGGFPSSLESASWRKCETAPSWAGSRIASHGMSMWRTRVTNHDMLPIPPTATQETTMCFVIKRATKPALLPPSSPRDARAAVKEGGQVPRPSSAPPVKSPTQRDQRRRSGSFSAGTAKGKERVRPQP